MLLKKAKDKEFWRSVATDPAYKGKLDDVKWLYENRCNDDIKALKFSKYIIFHNSGSRKEYERDYFDRRARFNACALMSLIYDDNDEYLEKLQDVIWAICDEYCWALPAHVKLEDGCDTTYLDLFASETGFALSEIYYLLEDRLNPFLKERMKYEINRRVIDSFASRKFYWEAVENNWAAVCAGSVGAAYMYMAPDRFYDIKPRIDAAMDAFLASYKSDGACREGLGYWLYGFGFFVYYADLLKDFSGGKYDYFKDEKVRQIASFQHKVYLQGNTVVSFADGSMTGNMPISPTHYLKKRYPDHVKVLPISYENAYANGRGDHCYRWAGFIRNFVWLEKDLLEGEELEKGFHYLQDSAYYINKKDRYAFAAKAGDNEEPHNHNDIGNFIIASGGRQVICDLGAGEYTRQYFTEGLRYTFFVNSSLGHSVPIIGGQAQKAGLQYRGDVLRADDGIFELEMKDAYGIKELTSLVRTFQLSDSSVKLTDKFVFDGAPLSVTERFISIFKPQLPDGAVCVGDVKICYDADKCKVSIKEEQYKTHKAGPATAYCIDFELPDGADSFEAEYVIGG